MKFYKGNPLIKCGSRQSFVNLMFGIQFKFKAQVECNVDVEWFTLQFTYFQVNFYRSYPLQIIKSLGKMMTKKKFFFILKNLCRKNVHNSAFGKIYRKRVNNENTALLLPARHSDFSTVMKTIFNIYLKL